MSPSIRTPGFAFRFAAAVLGLLVPVAAAEQRWEQAVETMPVAARPALKNPAATGTATRVDAGRTPPNGTFSVPEGFRVERVFVVPKQEMGSWVSLATDARGRLIAGDEADSRGRPGGGDGVDRGLYRITPAPLDGSTPTVVERIPAPITGVQGLLWAFDALYVVRNRGKDSGLYRLTDSDGDDMPDKVELLRGFKGSDDHGPHNVLLSPDGKRLLVIAGNYTKLPFPVRDVTPPQTMGGIRSQQRRVALPDDGTSRLPATWDEDLIIPRMWDASGHAVGLLAPGGWIASTDPDGKSWEVWSAGYRNAYDMAFNADGELFAYDADMEWDFGTPWYRPTRVTHASSGSEFGWRSGTGKWPAAWPDSLPSLLDVGPGSPVGVAFGYGLKFPARLQRALFICDWTFGTIYAVHLEPHGSTYKAVKEEFLSRTPLPIAEVTVGGDGAMYFVVGGRGIQSEVYRVTYTGPEPTAPVDARDPRGGEERAVRHRLEAFHAPQADPAGVITAAIGVARQAEPAAQPAVLAALDGVDPEPLDAQGRIDLARAYELAIIRLGDPPADAKARIAARFSPLFPSGHFELDRSLSSLLVAVRAPGIVSRLVGLLAAPSTSAATTNLGADEADVRRLLERNATFGDDARRALERRADLIQVHYAYVLRTVREPGAWTGADRRTYHRWFARAEGWQGGKSFRKFLENMEDESLAGLSDADKKAAREGRTAQAPVLPKPEGPGRPWTIADVLAAADKGLASGRDFERGKRAFAAARCIICHRFDGDGGATGPDLTQAAGRFPPADLVEAIVDPSKVIANQYKGSVIQTTDGKVITGRIASESESRIVVVADPEDATKVVELDRADIEEIAAAKESLMPRGLLDQLSEREVLDLLAYTLARGDAGDPRFK